MLDDTDLTPREREVAALLLDGLELREIAERLVLSEKTVRNYVDRMREKAGVRSRAALVAWLVHHGEPTVEAAPVRDSASFSKRRNASMLLGFVAALAVLVIFSRTPQPDSFVMRPAVETEWASTVDELRIRVLLLQVDDWRTAGILVPGRPARVGWVLEPIDGVRTAREVAAEQDRGRSP
jgi:DNA-binding CsgD family transcriptional regulator